MLCCVAGMPLSGVGLQGSFLRAALIVRGGWDEGGGREGEAVRVLWVCTHCRRCSRRPAQGEREAWGRVISFGVCVCCFVVRRRRNLRA